MFLYNLASFYSAVVLVLVAGAMVGAGLTRNWRYLVVALVAGSFGVLFVLLTVPLGGYSHGETGLIDVSFNRMLRGGIRPDPIGLSIPAVLLAIVVGVGLSFGLVRARSARARQLVLAAVAITLVSPPLVGREATLSQQQRAAQDVEEGVRASAEEKGHLLLPPFDLIEGAVEVEAVYEDTGFATTLVTASSGEFFIGRRTGEVLVADEIGDELRPLVEFDAESRGEAGLLAMVLHPDYPVEPYLYVYYTEDGFTRNRVARVDTAAAEPEVDYVVDDLPAARMHNGGGMAFRDDGQLYVAVGEADHLASGVASDYPPGVQDMDNLRGKVLRLTPDGEVPSDNPVDGSPVYALGFRSPYRLHTDPETDVLYMAENGPEVDDEINVVEALGNYGWPEATGPVASIRFTDPVLTVERPIGITGLATYYDGPYEGAPDGDVYFCGWHSGLLFRMPMADAVSPFEPVGQAQVYQLPEGLCRLDLVQGPDGYLYFLDLGAMYRISDLNPADLEPVGVGIEPLDQEDNDS